MYQIYSESAKTLTDSGNIRLPRFQRKQTWNDKKNFALCISIFNEYPIGMFVLNEEILRTKNGPLSTLWLLDGRQRRNALLQLFDNPENIYVWAKKFIKFKHTDSEDEIERKFWDAIEEHLESDDDYDEENDNITKSENEIKDNEVEEEYDDSNIGLEDYNQETSATTSDDNEVKYHSGLNLLLKIVLMCHKITPKFSGYSRCFDFSPYFVSIDYVQKDSLGRLNLNGSLLTTFISSFNNTLDKNGIDDFSSEDFYKYLITRYTLNSKTDTERRLRKYIDANWEKIKYSIFMVKQLALVLHNTKIGVIKLTDGTNSDAQNIFKLINSSGTTLTAVEILSAKPSWNQRITNPSQKLIDSVIKLYDTLQVKRDGVVLWDYPATFLDRLTNLDFIFPNVSYSDDSQFKSKVTLGFKLLAAIFEGGVTKDKISGLSRSKKINWDEVDSTLEDLNLMGRILKETSLFQYLKTWDATLLSLTSEAISINFTVLLYKNWIDKGRPIGSNSAVFNSFKKDAFSLFDKMIYEYTLRVWRGSSDSKIADNISSFNPAETFKSLPTSKWLSLIEDLIEKETILDQKAEQKDIKAIIYYYYVLSGKYGPDNQLGPIEMDHIISKYTFTSTTGINSHRVNNVCNFCLLAKSINNAKKERSLHEIHQLASTNADIQLLQQRISLSTDIPINDFSKFSTALSFDDLVSLRKGLIINSFTTKRDQLLN